MQMSMLFVLIFFLRMLLLWYFCDKRSETFKINNKSQKYFMKLGNSILQSSLLHLHRYGKAKDVMSLLFFRAISQEILSTVFTLLLVNLFLIFCTKRQVIYRTRSQALNFFLNQSTLSCFRGLKAGKLLNSTVTWRLHGPKF